MPNKQLMLSLFYKAGKALCSFSGNYFSINMQSYFYIQSYFSFHYNSSVMAFGGGKRNCIGEALAKPRLFLLLASLVQRFKFVADEDHPLPSVDPRSCALSSTLVPNRFHLKALIRD